MNIFSNLGQDIIEFYHSGFFLVIKFLLGIYSLVLVADLLLIVVLRGFGKDYRMTMTGMNVPPQKAGRKKWDKIKKRLGSPDSAQYKIAILEADKMIDKILENLGHQGQNMPERLGQLMPGQIEHSEDLIKAHQVRNNIIHDKDYPVSLEKAQETLGLYEKFLDHFELI